LLANCLQKVTVTNPSPSATGTGPGSGAIYAVGTLVNFTGSFTDNVGLRRLRRVEDGD
jgi:hypothetical protein